MSNNIDDAVITLTSSDNTEIQISVKAARGSEFIVDTYSLRDEGVIIDNEVPLDLPNVNSITLQKIVDFLNEYAKHPFRSIDYDSIRGQGFEQVITHPYYKTFMEDLEEGDGFNTSFYELKAGANYMCVTPLLELICVYLTYKCESAPNGAAIRSLLRIPAMTPGELRDLRTEHPWMFTMEDEALTQVGVEAALTQVGVETEH